MNLIKGVTVCLAIYLANLNIVFAKNENNINMNEIIKNTKSKLNDDSNSESKDDLINSRTSHSINSNNGHSKLKAYVNGEIKKMNYVLKIKGQATVLIKVPRWKPKVSEYKPQNVDWNGVITGCRAACRFDKRLCNFYVRAIAHDSLSISEGYGGADGSLILTQDEISRPENNYDSFTYILSKNVLALAKKYDSSVSDILAVCGAVATEFHGGPKIIKQDRVQPFLVGRLDNIIPNPGKSLAAANLNTMGFTTFAQKRNLTIDEMTALMGSHSLLDTTGCLKTNGRDCDPRKEPCQDLTMYKWSNKYYKDVCTPTIRINIPRVKSTLPFQTVEYLRLQEMCKFTSKQLRDRALDVFDTEIVPLNDDPVDPNALVTDLGELTEDVTWFDSKSISRPWNYSINDAYLGQACQGKLPKTDYNINIGKSMNTFKNSKESWDTTYIRAYKKMINTGVNWSVKGGLAITGDECPSGYKINNVVNMNCVLCNEKARISGKYKCPANCKCSSAFNDDVAFYE
jgi:hypothetical protein